MLKRQELLSLSATHGLHPDLDDVAQEDIAAAGDVPETLALLWVNVGCGWFSDGLDGSRVSDFMNRLLHPSDVQEIRRYRSSNDIDWFAYGIPFFETADLNYFVVTPEGRVLSPQVDGRVAPIADSLESFVHELVRDPEFWLSRLPADDVKAP